MKTATFHHQLAPGQNPNLSEIGPNLDFATLENSKRLRPIYAMVEYSLARSALLRSQPVFLSLSTGYSVCFEYFNPSDLPGSH